MTGSGADLMTEDEGGDRGTEVVIGDGKTKMKTNLKAVCQRGCFCRSMNLQMKKCKDE